MTPFLKNRKNTKLKRTLRVEVGSTEVTPDIDLERPSSRKFRGAVVVALQKKIIYTFTLQPRYVNNEWPALKTIPTMPSFMAMSRSSRTELISQIFSSGNTPSRQLTAKLGITARQIGQIRRWWIDNWQTRKSQ
jgi:hypothetical protein